MQKLLLSFLFFFSFLFVFAQENAASLVTWKYTYSPENPKIGETITLTLTATIAKGYHIYATPQTASPAWALKVENAGSKGVEWGEMRLGNAPITYNDEVANADFSVFEEKMVVTQTFLVTQEHPVLKGRIVYTYGTRERNNVQKAFPFKVKFGS